MAGVDRFPSQLAERFQIRLPDGLRDRIKADAEANGRSMNAEIIARLSGDERDLRDWFAGQALAGSMAYPGDESRGSHHNNNSPEGVARYVYALADAMLAQRSRTDG